MDHRGHRLMGNRLACRFDLEDEAWRLAGYFQKYAPPPVLGGGAFFYFLTQTIPARAPFRQIQSRGSALRL